MTTAFLISNFIKLFFLLSPFSMISVFLTFAKGLDHKERKMAVGRTILTVIIVCFTLLWFGNSILSLLGISLDGFRIGAGTVLFMTAISLIRGTSFYEKPGPEDDFAIVPLGLPVIVGPGTIGYLLIIGGIKDPDIEHERLLVSLSLVCVILTLALFLYSSNAIARIMGKRGLAVLSKVTGLVLAAMSADIVFTGIKNFMA
ncbi:MAG: MarC family protein [Phycisphaerae bacterium]|nr:MarC family protein [Phycisphaerae bacterium]